MCVVSSGAVGLAHAGQDLEGPLVSDAVEDVDPVLASGQDSLVPHVGEMLRGDRRGGAAGLATSQWIGIFMIAAGTAMFVWTRRSRSLARYTPPA